MANSAHNSDGITELSSLFVKRCITAHLLVASTTRISGNEFQEASTTHPSSMLIASTIGENMVLNLSAKCFNATVMLEKHQERCPWCIEYNVDTVINQQVIYNSQIFSYLFHLPIKLFLKVWLFFWKDKFVCFALSGNDRTQLQATKYN